MYGHLNTCQCNCPNGKQHPSHAYAENTLVGKTWKALEGRMIQLIQMASNTAKKFCSTAVLRPFQNMPLFLLLLDLSALSHALPQRLLTQFIVNPHAFACSLRKRGAVG